MLDFFRKKPSSTALSEVSQYDDRKSDNGSKNIWAGYAATESAVQSTQKAAKTFEKTDIYTGNRQSYDDDKTRENAKNELFDSGKAVKDPYTGKTLVRTVKEAKMRYGDKWTEHLAESDHVKPLEQIFNDTKGNVWNTKDDIKAAANSGDNIKVVSKKFNRSKSSRTNAEFVKDEEFLQRTGVKLSKDGKAQAIRDGEVAEKSINAQLRKSSFNNIVRTGHEAGTAGAKCAGVTTLTMSGIMNMVSVIKGEKSGEDAVADTIKDGGKAAVTGYAMSSSLTVVSHSLSGSSSQFVQGLVKNNMPGKVITAVVVTGDTLKKWGNGEMTTQECLIELGDKGLNMATMAVGQMIIPIPIVGGAVGALVGSMLTSELYHSLISDLQRRQLEHEERMRIIEECNKAAAQARVYRAELERYLDSYFQEYRSCFDEALSSMQLSYEIGDADGVIAGANDITRKLGGSVMYETVEEFRTFLDNGDDDIL